MAYAYHEKIARINLTTSTVTVEHLDPEVAKKFIGGRGLGTKIIYDEGCATVDPLSADNKLVYITGPLTGATAPSSGRYMVVTKSPLTGMIASSNSGGIWGAKLKYAGWDALIVEGEAPEKCPHSQSQTPSSQRDHRFHFVLYSGNAKGRSNLHSPHSPDKPD